MWLEPGLGLGPNILSLLEASLTEGETSEEVSSLAIRLVEITVGGHSRLDPPVSSCSWVVLVSQ